MHAHRVLEGELPVQVAAMHDLARAVLALDARFERQEMQEISQQLDFRVRRLEQALGRIKEAAGGFDP